MLRSWEWCQRLPCRAMVAPSCSSSMAMALSGCPVRLPSSLPSAKPSSPQLGSKSMPPMEASPRHTVDGASSSVRCLCPRAGSREGRSSRGRSEAAASISMEGQGHAAAESSVTHSRRSFVQTGAALASLAVFDILPASAEPVDAVPRESSQTESTSKSDEAVASKPKKPLVDTESWYRFRGEGFAMKVPPEFEDIVEYDDSGNSLYGERAKEKPFAAQFASPDRKVVLSVVIRNANQLKLSFFEMQDITEFGSLEEAARMLVPGRLNEGCHFPPRNDVQARPQTCIHALAVANTSGDTEPSLHLEGPPPRAPENASLKGSPGAVWVGQSQYRGERSLNRRIVEAPDAEYVLAIVTEALRKPHWGQARRLPLSPLNCATALHRIAKQMDAASMLKSERLAFARRREMRELLAAAATALPECSAQGLANIAWALSKIGGSALFLEEADLLAATALAKLAEFNAQNLANTAGACASMLHAAPSLFSGLALQAGCLAETFRPQELVQILWAFACLNHPLDPLFDALDALVAQRPDAQASTFRGFSQQQLASMAWSTAVLRQMRRPWFTLLWKTVNMRAASWGSELNTCQLDLQPKGAQHLSQLYQASLTLRLEYADLNLATGRELEVILDEAWEREKAAARTSSGHHKEVDRLLVGTGRKWVSEYRGAEYSLDLALVEEKVALEIDGPTHFTRNTDALLGHTALKRRLLRAAGWTVIPLPYQEWEELRGEQERTQYLRKLLEGAI